MLSILNYFLLKNEKEKCQKLMERIKYFEEKQGKYNEYLYRKLLDKYKCENKF